VAVQPGETETLSLTLHNIGNHTETYTLVPSGLLAGWVRVEPPTVTLFGGTSEVIEVAIRPPQLPTTPAGPAPLTVRVIPLDEPDEVVIAESTAIIGTFDARHIRLLQPVVRSRRRASYEFLVENAGNSQANCRLHLIETTHRLDGDFNPAAVGIEPGGTSLVRLRMKAIRRQWTRGVRTIPFSIEADQQGFPTAVANGTFVQTPMVPERIGARIAGVVLFIGALAAAWFAVIKPATKRAAEDAVRDQPGAEVVVTTVPVTTPVTVAPASTVPGDTLPPTTAPVITAVLAPSTPATDEGVLFSKRLAVTVASSEGEKSDTITVAPNQELRITDIDLQNVHRDSGLATVTTGDNQIIWQWDLGSVYFNNEPLSFRSAIVLPAGSTLTFTVKCDAPGTSGSCIEGLLVSGRLVTL